MASLRRPAVALALLLLGLLLGWLVREVTEVPGVPAPSGVRDAAPLTQPKPASEKDHLRRENVALRERIAAMEAPEARAPEEPSAPVPPPSPATRTLEPAVKLAGESGDPDAATLRVLVRDAEGRPQGGIKVGTWVVWNSQVQDRRDAVTGPAGTAEFQGLPAGDRRVAMDVLQGSQSVQAALTGGRVTEVAFRVEGGVRIEGTVRDEGKGPMGGVSLSLARHDGPVGTWLHATSDGRGRYRFDAVPPGRWTAFLHAEPSRKLQVGIDVIEGRPLSRDFVFGAGLAGVVRDGTTGAGIAGVRVDLPRLYRSAVSEAGGRFDLPDLAPGAYDLQVSRDGYGFISLRGVEVPEGGRTLDIEMTPAAVLVLHVLDPGGKPCVGRLFLGIDSKVEGAGTRVGTSVTVDESGRGVFRQIVPGSYGLRFRAEDGGQATLDVEVATGETEVEVHLKAKGP